VGSSMYISNPHQTAFPGTAAEKLHGLFSYTPIAQRVEVKADLNDPAIAKKLWIQSEKMVSAVLDEPDPDKYFVGKKSTKEDGRRSRVPKPPVTSTAGGSTLAHKPSATTCSQGKFLTTWLTVMGCARKSRRRNALVAAEVQTLAWQPRQGRSQWS
jgi:hypothetical protein